MERKSDGPGCNPVSIALHAWIIFCVLVSLAGWAHHWGWL